MIFEKIPHIFIDFGCDFSDRIKDKRKHCNLEADKGNATVVMNATEHNDKINCLLSDSSIYSKLSKKSNGFPTRTTFLTSRQPRSQNTQYNRFTSIPYEQGTSEKIKRVLNEAGMEVAMKPIHTNGRILPSPKDPLTLEENSCLVYQVPCFDCDFVYIGQTKRDLKSRLAEHKLAIRNQEPEKSSFM